MEIEKKRNNLALQAEVNRYVSVVKNYPLIPGQLESMVILHFDIPDKQAKEMVKTALESKIWHCVFCGRHYEGGPPTITARIVGKDHPLRCCPYCQEYKGLEVCNPDTCDCWELEVVRHLAEASGWKPQS